MRARACAHVCVCVCVRVRARVRSPSVDVRKDVPVAAAALAVASLLLRWVLGALARVPADLPEVRLAARVPMLIQNPAPRLGDDLVTHVNVGVIHVAELALVVLPGAVALPCDGLGVVVFLAVEAIRLIKKEKQHTEMRERG